MAVQWCNRLYASEWYNLFSSTDARSTLTSRGRLSKPVEEAKVKVGYYLNPTPNDDRNVEFDPKQNLLKKLNEFEGVSEP
jgi:hypothetical protein